MIVFTRFIHSHDYRNTVIGLSSFGDGDVYKPMTACSPDRNPQVYANVPALMDWITEHTVGADVYNSNCQKIKYDCFVDLHNYWQRKPPNKQNGAQG